MGSKRLIFIIVIFCYSLSGTAQDTITFLNGKVLIGTVEETDDVSTQLLIVKKNKSRLKIIETLTLFSVQYEDGRFDTLYNKNTEQDLTLSRKEMYLFILGEQDARLYFKPYLNALGGVVFGASFGYLLHNGFYVAGVPLAYTIGSGISNVKVKNAGNRSSQILIHPAYQEGYIKVARARKSFYALASSSIGTLIGAYIGNTQQ
jgi:hypothetical protein